MGAEYANARGVEGEGRALGCNASADFDARGILRGMAAARVREAIDMLDVEQVRAARQLLATLIVGR